jgi:tripartite-type tricarboxylate transporter receptor subunit TctC
MRRREMIAGMAGLLAGGRALPALAQAASWPERPVKLILPYAPGGATDLIGRPWAERLSQAFKQQFVIENRGGASGTIGTEAVARSAPDGNTLLLFP